jgi:hypothetical protein
LRMVLAGGFLLMSIIAFKNPASAWLDSRLDPFWLTKLLGVHSGRWFDNLFSPGLYQARIILEIILGCLLLLNSLLLFLKKTRAGIVLGFGQLLVYLGTVNMLLFYFEQFSTIILVVYQYALLIGIIYYRTRFSSPDPPTKEAF